MIIFRLYLKLATNELLLSNLPPQTLICAEGELDTDGGGRGCNKLLAT